MEFGVIADTHDNLRAAETAVELFEAEGVETVVHCGDVIAPPMVPAFEGLEIHLVFGNNDGERAGLRDAVEGLGNGSQCHGRFARLEFGDRSIAVLHGEDLNEVRGYAETGAFEYVLHGHHHEARAIEVDDTTILNPGAHFPAVPAQHRSVAIVETTEPRHHLVRID